MSIVRQVRRISTALNWYRLIQGKNRQNEKKVNSDLAKYGLPLLPVSEQYSAYHAL